MTKKEIKAALERIAAALRSEYLSATLDQAMAEQGAKADWADISARHADAMDSMLTRLNDVIRRIGRWKRDTAYAFMERKGWDAASNAPAARATCA